MTSAAPGHGFPSSGPDYYDTTSTRLQSGRVVVRTARQLQADLGTEKLSDVRKALLTAMQSGHIMYDGSGAEGDFQFVQVARNPFSAVARSGSEAPPE